MACDAASAEDSDRIGAGRAVTSASGASERAGDRGGGTLEVGDDTFRIS